MTKQVQTLSALLPLFTAVVLTISVSAQANTVATVNGKILTDEDLKSLVSTLPDRQKESMLNDKVMRAQLIQSLIDQELMVQEASAKKIEDSKEYKEALMGFKKQALSNLLVQKQLASKVTDASTLEYFNKNKNHYSTDQVHAQHILVSTAKEADAILEEAKKPGADFQAIAEKKSKDPSAKNNRGDVGFFSRETYDPAFADAAFTAKVGSIVGPVKTAFGYHVIKIVDRKVGKIPEFVEVEQKVKIDVQRDLLQKYLAELRKKASIKQ